MIFFKKPRDITRQLLLSLIFLSGVVFSMAAQANDATSFNVQHDTLDNGMDIVLIQNNRAPVAHHAVYYRVGAADEVRGKSGLAHFFEHLMFRGTPTLPDGEFSKKIARLGGNDNAFTAQDYTAYHQSVPVEHLGTVMAMEADRMVNLDLSDDVIETERQVILQERRQNLENSPFGRFSERFNSLIYANHPYDTPIIGWAHEIEGYSHQDIRDFYRHWYAPNNAILVVSGDIGFDDFKALAKTHYAPLKRKGHFGERTRPHVPKNLTPDFAIRVNFKDPQIKNKIYQRSILVPSERMVVKNPENHDAKTSNALSLLSEILSGGQASLLQTYFVDDLDIALNVSTSYRSGAHDIGRFDISVTAKDDIDFDQIDTALTAFLNNFSTTVLEDDLVEKTIKRYQASTIYAQDSLTTPARIFGHARALNIDIEHVQNWHTEITKVTAQDIIDAFNTYVHTTDNNQPIAKAWLTPPPKNSIKDAGAK